jgi:hypothetical protein
MHSGQHQVEHDQVERTCLDQAHRSGATSTTNPVSLKPRFRKFAVFGSSSITNSFMEELQGAKGCIVQPGGLRSHMEVSAISLPRCSSGTETLR